MVRNRRPIPDLTDTNRCEHEPRLAKGLCKPCYYRNYNRLHPKRKPTAPATCHPDKVVHARGLCRRCYRKTNYSEREKLANKRRLADYATRNPGYARETQLRRNYGLSLERYAEMLAAQGNACAICRTRTPRGHGAFHVDHCHDTGRIRGLLCHNCNVGLGNFKDSTSHLVAAIEYLKETK